MGWFSKKEKLPPSWEAKWYAHDDENFRTIQGRAATKEEAVTFLSQRYEQTFGLEDGYTYFECVQVKPETER